MELVSHLQDILDGLDGEQAKLTVRLASDAGATYRLVEARVDREGTVAISYVDARGRMYQNTVNCDSKNYKKVASGFDGEDVDGESIEIKVEVERPAEPDDDESAAEDSGALDFIDPVGLTLDKEPYTVAAYRNALRRGDDVGFTKLEKELTKQDWRTLADGLNDLKVSMSGMGVDRWMIEEASKLGLQEGGVGYWMGRLFYAAKYSPSWEWIREYEIDRKGPSGRGTYLVKARRIADVLHKCGYIVHCLGRVLTIDPEVFERAVRRGGVRIEDVEELRKVAIGSCKAAETWSQMPEEIAAGLAPMWRKSASLSKVPLYTLAQLERELEENACALDDNGGRKDKRVARWWESWNGDDDCEVGAVVVDMFDSTEAFERVTRSLRKGAEAWREGNKDVDYALKVLCRPENLAANGLMLTEEVFTLEVDRASIAKGLSQLYEFYRRVDEGSDDSSEDCLAALRAQKATSNDLEVVRRWIAGEQGRRL